MPLTEHKHLELSATMRVQRLAVVHRIDLHTYHGYHQFRDERGQPYGSFEVFGLAENNSMGLSPGFYWIACFPNCLPDGEPIGPSPTDEGAYLDAIGD